MNKTSYGTSFTTTLALRAGGIYLGLERSILGVAAVVCYVRRGVVSQCQRTNHAATAAVK